MIYGIQKLSLVDYPGKPALVLFLGGCNLRCPYCHNDSIVSKKSNTYTLEYVKTLLKSRIHFLNGVVVTGGEPTLYGDDLIALLEELRQFPFSIKLDTNGTNPALIKEIIEKDLVDYIAMDIKNTFDKYEETVGTKINTNAIKKSIGLLENSNIYYEFRMTINKTMHTSKNIKEVLTYLKYPNKLLLQPYQFNENQIIKKDFKAFSKDELQKLEEDLHITIKN
ncbi:MAG: anaerobic ribonucleoside-triphosphate reductase activating protein [Bacilli bacterium]|nr:anaerobic ribonucleoside-triphosphate reductase activating protein [Bacilli bacterium]